MKTKPTIVVQKRQPKPDVQPSYGVADGQIYLAADGSRSGHVVVDAHRFAMVNDVIVWPFDATTFYQERRIDAFKLARVRYYLAEKPVWMPKV